MTAPLPLINLTATQIPHGSATQLAIELDWEKQAPDDTRKVRVPILTIRRATDGRIDVTFSTDHTMTVGEQVHVTGSAVMLHAGLFFVHAIVSSTVVVLDKVYQGDETFTTGNALAVQATGNFTTDIQRRPLSGGTWIDICVIGLGTGPASEGTTVVPIVHTDSFIDPAIEWEYRVRAVNFTDEASAWHTRTESSHILGAMPAPLVAPVLTAIRSTSTTAQMSWVAADPSAKHWEIERAVVGTSVWTRIYYSSAPESKSSHTDATLTPGVDYKYRIRHRFVFLDGNPLTGHAWQNQDDLFDVNDNGAVDWRDFRLFVSYGVPGPLSPGNWPDFVVSTCLPQGGNRPSNDPAVDPPPVDATFAPDGAFVDLSGDGLVTPVDQLLLNRRFNNHGPTPPRSVFSNEAEALTEFPAWYLLWSTYIPGHSGAKRSWPDGRDIENIAWNVPAALREFSRGISVDRLRGLVYVVAGNSGPDQASIWTVPLNGDGYTLLKSTGAAWGVTVDQYSEKIYYNTESTIRRMNTDGSNDEEIVPAGTFTTCYGMAVDGLNSTLYFSHSAPDGGIYKCDLDGSNLTKIYTRAAIDGVVWGLSYRPGIGPLGDLFFTTSLGKNEINKLDTVTNAVTFLYTTDTPQTWGVDTRDETDELFYISMGDGIFKANINGTGTPELLIDRDECGDSGGDIAVIIQDQQPPAALTEFKVYSRPDGVNELVWNPTSIPSTHKFIEILRSTTNRCGWEFLATLTDGLTPTEIAVYLDTSVVAGTRYHYRVRSVVDSKVPSTPSPVWQNDNNPLDANNDGIIGVEDRDVIVDYANLNGLGALPGSRPSGEPFVDVDVVVVVPTK